MLRCRAVMSLMRNIRTPLTGQPVRWNLGSATSALGLVVTPWW
jgi:hypothetical protein